MLSVTFRSLLLIFFAIFLSACGDIQSHSLSKMCDDQPAICEDLHQIADCRFIRTSVIRARYQHALEKTENNTRFVLEELDAYKSCLELTLQIAYTRYKDRKRKRLENYLKSKELINQLLKEAVGTTDPNLAYYLWTNYQDLGAKQIFLNAANKPNLADPYLLSKLAAYHSSDEPQRSVEFFYLALSKTENIEQLPNGFLIQLISLLFRHHLYNETYTWAQVATNTYQDSAPINFEMIINKGYISKTKQEELNELAQQYIEMLDQGSFKEEAPILFKNKVLMPGYN